MAFFWVFGKPLAIPGLSDTVVSICGAILLFIVPVHFSKGVFVLEWKYAKDLPWNIILLFGGGLALARGMQSSGLSEYIGQMASQLHGIPVWALMLITALVIVFLTEITSNTATTTTFLPILGAVALEMGIDGRLLVIPAAMAASCAFMLPVATPPNAVVFGSGRITLPQMAKSGFALNLVSFLFITLYVYVFGSYYFDF